MVVYYEVVVIMVFVCCYSLLSPCSCTRQVEFKYIRGDHGQNHVAQGYNNHDGMSMTEKHQEVHSTGAASELDLSSLPRKLLVESADTKKSHQKISGDSSEHERQKEVVSSFSSKNMMAVPRHRPPPPNKYDPRPTFHVDYSVPRTHPPKNNR